MGLTRSTFYAEPRVQPIDEARLVEQIKAVCAEWPAYGYRRVTAELHGEGRIVNHKKVMRLMKENGLTVQPRRRFIATTDSDHDGPIFPNLAENVVPTDLNQLWVADITYIAIATGFVYLAAILDAWSRRVVGYAIGKRVDARLAVDPVRPACFIALPDIEPCRRAGVRRDASLLHQFRNPAVADGDARTVAPRDDSGAAGGIHNGFAGRAGCRHRPTCRSARG
jgi:transposase InsO family protein